MKFKKILVTLIVPMLIPITVVAISAKQETPDVAFIDFLTSSELKIVERIDNKKHKIDYYKIINTTNNKKVLFIQFDGMSSFIDMETLITLEINWEQIDQSSFKAKDIDYIAPYGLLYKQNGFYYKLDSNDRIAQIDTMSNMSQIETNGKSISEIKEKAIKNRLNSFNRKSRRSVPDVNREIFSSVPNVSYKIPHAWWWASRDTNKEIGYYDVRYGSKGLKGVNHKDLNYTNSGVCEYIAMSNLLLYHELFTTAGVFSDTQYNRYIDPSPVSNSTIDGASPTFKNYNYNNPDDSLARKLFDLNGELQRIQQPYHYKNTINKFMTDGYQNNYVFNDFEHLYKYGGFYRAWENVKRGMPVVLTVAEMRLKPLNHAMIAYGYDDSTDTFLVNYLWGDSNTSKKLYSYYTPVWGSYFYAMDFTNTTKYPLRKAFSYNGQEYTGEEFHQKIING